VKPATSEEIKLRSLSGRVRNVTAVYSTQVRRVDLLLYCGDGPSQLITRFGVL